MYTWCVSLTPILGYVELLYKLHILLEIALTIRFFICLIEKKKNKKNKTIYY